MPHAIETRDLCRRFGPCLAVDHVSMTVPRRGIYGFLGRNGAGKTTTLRLLLGLLRADAGQVRVGGIDVATRRLEAARHMGALLETGFYASLSGRTNLDLARRLLGCPTREIDRVLDVVELAAHGNRRVADYSLGMRQRLALARAMLGAPPILVLDEPTNGLDPEGIAAMRGLLSELPARVGATVLLSSHQLGEIEQVASHIGILREGRLVLEGELAALKATLAAQIEFRTDAPPRASAIAKAHGFSVHARDADALLVTLGPGDDPRAAAAALNKALCAGGVAVHAVVPRVPSLEHLYRQASRSAGEAVPATAS